MPLTVKSHTHTHKETVSDSGYLLCICEIVHKITSGIMKVLVFLLSVQSEMERKAILLYTEELGDQAESESGFFFL